MIVFDNGTQFECDPVIDIEKGIRIYRADVWKSH